MHNINRRGNVLSPDETDTHFAITFERLFEFNSTQDFRQLCRAIGKVISVRSLPQIIHRKDQLIDILLENVNRKDNLALNAILELLVALAKDLNTDFYEHFDRVFTSVAKCLDSTDPETIESVFICLTFLFKYLSKYIIKEFDTKYKLFEDLLASKKDYIRRFSSEALSFLVRKAQNKDVIINILCQSVKNEPKLVDGIGLLLFESVKGVNSNLHSSAHNFIGLVIDKYLTIDNQAFDDTIVLFFKLLTENISKSNFSFIWKIFLKHSEDLEDNSRKIIPLLKEVIEHKKCQLVDNVSEVLKLLVKFANKQHLTQSDSSDLLTCFNYLQFNYHRHLSAEDYEQINQSIFGSKNLSIDQVFDYARSLFNCITFEQTVLPSLLNFCCQYLREDVLQSSDKLVLALKLVTELVVTKRPRPIWGKDIKTMLRYPLSVDQEVCLNLLRTLSSQNDLNLICSLLICLPHMTPILEDDILDKFKSIIIENLHKFRSQLMSNCANRCLAYIIVESITALIIIKHRPSLEELNSNLLIDLIIANPSNTEILRAFDLYLSYNKEIANTILHSNQFGTLYKKSLEVNLSSHSKTRRLLSLHILNLFDPPLPPSEDLESPKTSIFKICLDSESVLCDFSQYRLKLKHLQSLDHSYVKQSTPLPTSDGLVFDQMPIHYLFGVLYENFSLIWTPVIKIIETYAKGLEDKKLFMAIFLNHFKETTNYIKSNATVHENYYQKYLKDYFNSKYYSNNTSNDFSHDRPDFANHRILLLKAMDLFPEVIEPSNRDFISLLFEFIDCEMSYHIIISNNAKENIQLKEELTDHGMEVDLIEERPQIGLKTLWKTLFSFLNVLSKFKNPKALYREKELLEFNLNLLSSPDSEAQKHAFSCICNYDKYLTEFRNNFLRLIDDKTFKTEIYSFILNSEDETNILKSDQRPNVVPLVLRILYGKLMASNGTKTHGKNKSDFRRSIILKVLSAFNQNELILFMNFVFAPISQLIECDYTELKQRIDADLNIQSMTPLRQLQALIRTLQFASNHLGNNSLQITSYIFKVLVVISTLVSKLLTQSRTKINEQSIVRLKDIRNSCFKLCRNFFDTYDSYELTSAEIDAIFDGLIWPLLPHLNTESLNIPSPLLTLLISFSKNSRYFKLLAKCHTSDIYITPISKIIELYDNPKVQTPVIAAITELINNLLTLDDFDPIEHKLAHIEVNHLSIDLTNKPGLSCGTQLCLPFVATILNRIGLNFNNKRSDSNVKRKGQSFSGNELNILSRLTEYVTQTDQSLNLVLLLIHSVENRKIEELKEYQTMKALSHLAKNVKPHVNRVLKSLIPLFGNVSNCNSRTELCNTLKTLCEDNNQLSELSEIICDMNAFNPKFPEEPDYSKRVKAFKIINSKLESISRSEFTSELITLIIYDCTHFIQYCNDLAIRESASNTLKNLLMKLEHFNDNNLFETYAINLLLYSTISKGFRNKSETVRHELIDLLITMIEISGQRHSTLQQLSLLCNKEDEEIDFWLNIKHIQHHRRSRALKRLANTKGLLDQLSHRIYSEFLIPLTTIFLTEPSYAKNLSLVNASIEAIGVFSGHIQWSKYYHLLKYYVNQLINQKGDHKINIKIVCSLLDNFAFIRSSSKLFDSTDTAKFEVDEDENMTDHEVLNNDVRMDTDDDTLNVANVDAPNRIVDSISNNLLPLLHKVLHQKSQIDFAYDSMKSEFPEDEEIQRIPIGLALIKLIKSINLSDQTLKTCASSVILRLCQFLQSRAQSIRDSARNTFVKVMQCLGPQYLLSAVNQMKAILSKGYQRHVFVFTVHSILAELRPQLKTGDLDNCLDVLLETCTLELFGNLSEEKEVSEITSKLKEAKKSKSYDIFEIMSAFVSHNCLNKLLSPLKATLLEAHTHKVVRRVSQSLSKVSHGLVVNSGLNQTTVLSFIFTTIEDILSLLEAKQTVNADEVPKHIKRIDSFLISRPIYQRSEKVSKIGGTTNHHVLVEFGLNCLIALLKENRLESSNEEHLSLLDPFVLLLNRLLESNDPKLTTLSLQCLHILYTKFGELPSFGLQSESVMKNIFVLLHKYAKFGYNDKEDSNVQMILLCFKTLSLFIRDRTDVKITDEQMAVLLSYVDQDLHNDSCQSTVFIILKSIIAKNYNSLALHRIMKRVTEMAITSDIPHIRNNCSQICVKYLLDYSQPKGLKKKIDFFIRHLEYEQISGRESALSIIKHIITSIDYKFINKNIALLFVPLSSRLVNESSSECKKMIAESITKLLRRITESDRNKLFNEMIVPWLQSEQVLQKLLASHLCSLLLSVEGKEFSRHVMTILPFINQQLDPTRYQSSEAEDAADSAGSATVKNTDSLIYQHLSLFLKLIKMDPLIVKKHQLSDEFNGILEHTLTAHVLHPHLWIRVICVQIFGQLFSEYSTQCLSDSIDNTKESHEFLLSNSKDKLTQMVSKFCLIFRDIYDAEVLSDQLIKNLVYISRVFIQSSLESPKSSTFKWLLNKLIFEVKYEIKEMSHKNLKRICVFKWMAVVAVELGSDRLDRYMANFLPLLCREETTAETPNEDNQLLVLTKQVLQLLKNMVGSERFAEFYSKAKADISLKRIERKKKSAVQVLIAIILSFRFDIN